MRRYDTQSFLTGAESPLEHRTTVDGAMRKLRLASNRLNKTYLPIDKAELMVHKNVLKELNKQGRIAFVTDSAGRRSVRLSGDIRTV